MTKYYRKRTNYLQQAEAARERWMEVRKMTPEQKKWIDEASYEDLLRRWRFAPIGDLFFQDETGIYYQRVMNEKKEKLDLGNQVRISKEVGWDG